MGLKMRKTAFLVVIALAVIMSANLCPTVSSQEPYLPQGYYFAGQDTDDTNTYGVYAGIEVSDPDVNHEIRTNPQTFFYAWVGIWDLETLIRGYQVGWMETDTFDFRDAETGYQYQVYGVDRYSDPGDRQYLCLMKPDLSIRFYPEYELSVGMRIYVHIRHIGSGIYAAYISWVAGLEELTDSRVNMHAWFPNNYAEVTSVFGEVYIGDASGQIPGCPSGHGYRLEVRNPNAHHHGTRFWPIQIKLQDDPPEYQPPGGPGWETWSETLGAITYERDGPYLGEWLLPNAMYPWVKYDTRYYSWIFYTDCRLTIDSQDQYGSFVPSRVWIDAEYVGYCGDTFDVVPGWHEITVESVLYTATKKYTFQQWSDGATDNPRGIDIPEDTVLTAIYHSEPRDGNGGGGGGCVAKGTLITMADGSTKPVEKIKVGDQVLGFDPSTGSYSAENVLAVTSTKVDLIVNLNDGALRLTPTDQPVYIRNSTYEGWVQDPARIQVGWEIYEPQSSEWTPVISITYEEGKTRVYDFTTDNYQTYLANSYLLMDKGHKK